MDREPREPTAGLESEPARELLIALANPDIPADIADKIGREIMHRCLALVGFAQYSQQPLPPQFNHRPGQQLTVGDYYNHASPEAQGMIAQLVLMAEEKKSDDAGLQAAKRAVGAFAAQYFGQLGTSMEPAGEPSDRLQ